MSNVCEYGKPNIRCHACRQEKIESLAAGRAESRGEREREREREREMRERERKASYMHLFSPMNSI